MGYIQQQLQLQLQDEEDDDGIDDTSISQQYQEDLSVYKPQYYYCVRQFCEESCIIEQSNFDDHHSQALFRLMLYTFHKLTNC